MLVLLKVVAIILPCLRILGFVIWRLYKSGNTKHNKGSVTVKAEDRPSGLAGDSASVITFLFRLQSGLFEWRVLVAAARSADALVSRQAHATVANCL